MGDNYIENYIIQNQQHLYRLAYSYVHNQHDALDVVQESIYKAMSGKNLLKKSSSVRTWLYRIVVNTALDFLRKKKHEVVDLQEELLTSTDGGINDRYEEIDLVQALNTLPENCRNIVILHYFEDLTLEEVAEILNENLNTVKTRLYRSLKQLRIQMTEKEEAL